MYKGPNGWDYKEFMGIALALRNPASCNFAGDQICFLLLARGLFKIMSHCEVVSVTILLGVIHQISSVKICKIIFCLKRYKLFIMPEDGALMSWRSGGGGLKKQQ